MSKRNNNTRSTKVPTVATAIDTSIRACVEFGLKNAKNPKAFITMLETNINEDPYMDLLEKVQAIQEIRDIVKDIRGK